MAPIPTTITPAVRAFHTILDPAIKELGVILHHIGLKEWPDCPDDWHDEIDIPGEGGPGGGIGGGPTGAQRSGILFVIMMFAFLAVMFTVVAGWIWCVAAHEPTYYSVREGRRGSWKTKRIVPFREWYRRRRNLPRTKSDVSREEDYHRVLAFLSTHNWHGRVLSNGEPDDYDHTQWKRPKDTQFWREHGHKGSTTAFNPRSPLMSERGKVAGGYNTFSKEGGTGMEIPRVEGIEDADGGLFTSVPFSPLTVPVPPLRRPPLKGVKGRTASLSNSLISPGNEERRWYREQRSHSWGGCSGGSGGRPWRCGRRGSGDSIDSYGRRSSWGSSGRGSSRSSRSSRSSLGMGSRGLAVVVEEVVSTTEK